MLDSTGHVEIQPLLLAETRFVVAEGVLTVVLGC
jgi:hypothetical protein